MINIKDLQIKADRIAQERNDEEKQHIISYLESIQQDIEEEILNKMLNSGSAYCLNNLIKDLKKRGYREFIINESLREFFVATKFETLENGDKIIYFY